VVFNEEKLEKLSVVFQFERIDRIYTARFSLDSSFLAVGGFDGKCAIVPMALVWNAEESLNDSNCLPQVLTDSVIELERPGMDDLICTTSR
jgi:hypothetical protein